MWLLLLPSLITVLIDFTCLDLISLQFLIFLIWNCAVCAVGCLLIQFFGHLCLNLCGFFLFYGPYLELLRRIQIFVWVTLLSSFICYFVHLLWPTHFGKVNISQFLTPCQLRRCFLRWPHSLVVSFYYSNPGHSIVVSFVFRSLWFLSSTFYFPDFWQLVIVFIWF